MNAVTTLLRLCTIIWNVINILLTEIYCEKENRLKAEPAGTQRNMDKPAGFVSNVGKCNGTVTLQQVRISSNGTAMLFSC